MLPKLLKSLLPFRESARKNSSLPRNHVGRKAPAARLCSFERLEERTLLSVVPLTNQEQLLLELINRAREDPSAEAARYAIGLNDGLAPGTISATAKPPLSANLDLRDVARNHSQDMIDRDFWGHVNPDGQSAWDRVSASGYFATASGTWGMGENIAFFSGTHDAALRAHEILFQSPDHRENILGESFVDAGIGIRYGDYQTYGQSTLVTEVFGFRNAQRYITGVAFTDAVAANNFYDLGEGLGGVAIQARSSGGTLYTTTTASAGGYQVAVPNGTYTVTATGAGIGTVSFGNISVQNKNVKVDFTPGAPSTLTTNLAGAGDFDGDGTDDVLLRNSVTGRISTWIVDNGAYQRWSNIGVANPATAEVAGVGDFDGDGTDDVLFRNPTTGRISTWIIDNAAFQRWSNIGVANRWTTNTTGVGDFDGDGTDDVLLQNSFTGKVSTWIVDNGTFQRWSSIGTANLATTNVAGVGDFDGDGTDDVLLHNFVSGRVSTWIVHNGAFQRWSNIGVTNVATTNVSGVGDFDGDGTDDVLLYNFVSGRVSTWIVHNGAYQRWSNIGVANVATTNVSGVGDFDGDGTDDILLSNFVTGRISTWIVHNGAYQRWSSIGILT